MNCSVLLGFLIFRGKSKDRALVLSSFAFLGIIVLLVQASVGISIIYDRSWMYFFLIGSIISGFATTEAYHLCQQFLGKHIRQASILALSLVLILTGVSAFSGVRTRLKEPYYHIINNQAYADLLWIRENLNDYDRIVVDPAIAIAVAPVSGKFIYASFAANLSTPGKAKEVMDFFKGEAQNTQWLRDKNIDIVYTRQSIKNTDLQKVAERIYILKR